MAAENPQPVIIDNRFVLTPEMRHGGMATVHKAMDMQSSRLCAVKRMKPMPDDRLLRESFFREYQALQRLTHPNIVEMIACGVDAEGHPYIALDWVDENLEEWIARHGALSWQVFWPEIGRPLLDAIKTAQASKWIHRDIKPKNVLVADGIPKLTDYGIARDHGRVLSSLTLRHFASEPFSPPDKDDGSEHGFGRDVFSWAILAGYCLTGHEPADYGSIPKWLDTCAGAPVEILIRAASLSRDERPAYAAFLLEEIDTWVAERQADKQAHTCYVQIAPDALKKAAAALETSPATLATTIKEDFRHLQGARRSPDGEEDIRLYGESWMLRCRRDPDGSGLLRAFSARHIGPAEAERQRDAGFGGPFQIIWDFPRADPSANLRLDGLIAEAAADENERRVRSDSERVFRGWHAYLSARYEFEGSKASALAYTDRQVSGRMVSLTTSDPLPADIIGQDRLIRFGQAGSVALQVMSAIGDELTLNVVAGDPSRIPASGSLEVNTIRAQRALDRQRQALNAVTDRRCANPRLRDLLADPSQARDPVGMIVADDPGANFDDDKRAVLKKALNLQDILAVEGPPGTGKTRLIEEIVLQYLRAHPDHRILISSQTHVALDNVIERVRARQPDLDIVRVGREGDTKINPATADLLLERKAETWARSVSAQAEEWLMRWAREHRVEPSNVKAGMLAMRLSSLLTEAAELKKRTVEISRQTSAASVPAEGEDVISEEVRSELDTALVESEELERAIAANSQDQEAVRTALLMHGGIAAELADTNTITDLEGFGSVLLGDTPEHGKCRVLMELQQRWLDRVGRSSDFHGAMLGSAKVVAATCIGLAGVRGMEDVEFDLCIIDEASRATATEVLVPLAKSRRIILVGDPRQLPPFFEQGVLRSAGAGEFGETEIRQNVFERILERGPAHCREVLRHQHRMVEPIGRLISEVFYEGTLINEKTAPRVVLPTLSKPVIWIDTSALAERREQRKGTSFINAVEARATRNILRSLDFLASSMDL